MRPGSAERAGVDWFLISVQGMQSACAVEFKTQKGLIDGNELEKLALLVCTHTS